MHDAGDGEWDANWGCVDLVGIAISYELRLYCLLNFLANKLCTVSHQAMSASLKLYTPRIPV